MEVRTGEKGRREEAGKDDKWLRRRRALEGCNPRLRRTEYGGRMKME